LLSEWCGHILDRPLAPFAKRIPFSPNILTVTGLFVNAAAAALISYDLLIAGIVVLFGGVFDMFDGIVARANDKTTRFGAFLDSTLDRYSDSLLIIGAAWFFYVAGSSAGVLISTGALVGSLVTSYARARAEGLGVECKAGILERPERVVLIALGCVTSLLLPAMVIIFALSHVTVIQRIIHVHKQLK
jgi:phosphatidylglycerophosphate synthase